MFHLTIEMRQLASYFEEAAKAFPYNNHESKWEINKQRLAFIKGLCATAEQEGRVTFNFKDLELEPDDPRHPNYEFYKKVSEYLQQATARTG